MTSPMPPKRVFLGWDAPALPAAAGKLLERYRSRNTLDLGRVYVVLPGQRAGRRLLELLVDAADREGLRLIPPTILTEGTLPERLYVHSQPFAPLLVRWFAWAAAVQGLKAQERAILIPHPPEDAEHLRWLRVGEMLGQVHSELAADGHNADAVLVEGKTLPGFADHARWGALQSAGNAYRTTLSELGLVDPNASRLEAIKRGEVKCDCDIVLLGTVDLNSVLAQMLTQIADRVTPYVFAPQEMAERFDELGRLIPGAWQTVAVPIGEDQILYAGDPAGQAAAAAAWLARLNGQFSTNEVVIGVPDPAVVPTLRRRLAVEGIRARWVEDRTIADTSPHRMLATASECATDRRYEPFAAFLRHPDVTEWLTAEDLPVDLTELDTFHGEHLPVRMELADIPIEAITLRAVVERIDALLAPAYGDHRLVDWADIFTEILKQVYAGREDFDLDIESDRIRYETLERMLGAIDTLRDVPESLDRPLNAADAFAVAFEGIAQETVPPPHDPAAVQFLGWLELPFDDAPAVLVTTLNEGHVPSSAGPDPFLPDSLRERLGLEHNARRYARDAYATTVLARSKKQFACIVARRDAEKNPLAPSRLLFTGKDSEVIARASHWVREAGGESFITSAGADRVFPFALPKPEKLPKKPREFAVTQFRSYLACKYRYYLRHGLKLGNLTDEGRELDGGAFGTLLHEVLQAWGNDSKWRNCGDAVPLAEHLMQRLMTMAKDRFGQGRPAIRLQVAQAARRLKGFANHQAQLIAEGWRIVYVENDRGVLKAEFPTVHGASATLRGRIDRIDYHKDRNIVRILDYKTADKAVPPEKTHRKHDEWIDLQLPLYRHLWRSAVPLNRVPANAAIELAYFQIPREWDAAEVVVAKGWDESVLAGADETARKVIAGILAEDFWPPQVPAPMYSEDFAAICLDGLEAPPLTDDEEGHS